MFGRKSTLQEEVFKLRAEIGALHKEIEMWKERGNRLDGYAASCVKEKDKALEQALKADEVLASVVKDPVPIIKAKKEK